MQARKFKGVLAKPRRRDPNLQSQLLAASESRLESQLDQQLVPRHRVLGAAPEEEEEDFEVSIFVAFFPPSR